jgi:hypothetical protein
VNQVAAAGAAVSVPVVWSFLGFDFQAGPVIVGICAVIITRMLITFTSAGRRRLVVDVLVTALSALITALWIQAHMLDLLQSGVTGIGFGALGLGIIGAIKSQFATALRVGIQTALRALAAPTDPKP